MKPEFLEMCTKAIDAVIEQNAQSTAENGACMYRGKNGLKCVVGHMIPDELYSSKIEDNLVHTPELKAVMKEVYPEIESKDFLVLAALQDAHDIPDKREKTDPFSVRFLNTVVTRLSMPHELVKYAKQKLAQLQEQSCPSP